MKQLLFLLLFAVTACTTTIPVSQFEEKNDASVNTPLKKEIGNPIISFRSGLYCNAIRVNEGNSSKEPAIIRKVKAGEIYLNLKNGPKKEYYYPENTTFSNGFYNSTHYLVHRTDNNSWLLMIQDGLGFSGHALASPLQFTVIESQPDPKREFLQKSFIYNGKSGNTVKFSYREFINDLARPSFTQDLQYDLAESSVIGFQGMRIEVLKATNTDIEYKVLSGFTKI